MAQESVAARTNSTDKLFTFNWEGKDRSGNKSKGTVDARDIAAAKMILRRQGVFPTKLAKQRASILGSKDKPVKPVDIAFFTRQMATMMKSGVPMLKALEIVAGGAEKNKLKKLIYDIRAEVNSGTDFSKSLSKYPEFFDDLYCSLVEAGEQSGALETMLDRIATYKEKMESLKAKIKKALTYPIAVIVVGILVTAILLVKVVPVFEDVFSSFGADLPAFTMFVVNLSYWAQDWWWVGLLGAIGAGFAFKQAHLRSEKFRNWLDRSVLKIPVIGNVLFEAAVARFSRTLSTTFAAGVPLVQALDSCAGAAGNHVFRESIYQIRNGVAGGQSLTNAVNMTGIYPNMVVQMISIGEEAGSLEQMLDKTAAFYEESVDNAVDNLSSLLEPLIMVILGTLVGGLVIAMYLPIFQLGNVV